MAAIWGKICWAPCQALGKGCELLGRGCSGACDACSRACSGVEAFLCPPDKPSPIFLCFTVLCAGVPQLYAFFRGVLGLSADCDKDLALFLIIQGLVGAVWVGFAVHLYRQFSKPYTFDQANDSSPMSRAGRLCMYDPYVAVVFLLFPFSIAWNIIGLNWASAAKTCDSIVKDAVGVSTTFMFVYLGLGIAVGILSMCCECCRYTQRPREGGMPTHFQAHTQQPGVAHAGYPNTNMWVGGTLVGRILFPQVMTPPQRQEPFIATSPAIPVTSNPLPYGAPPAPYVAQAPSAPPMPPPGQYPVPPGSTYGGYARYS